MRPAYFEGLLAHLIATEQPAGIEKAETFADVGAQGHAWAPHGIKVTCSDGQAVFLSFARASAPTGDADDNQLVFNPEDLRVPAMRS